MNRQRGFVLPPFLAGTLAKLVLVLLIVSAVGGIVYAAKSYLDGLDEKGYQRGVKEITAKVALRDNAQLVEAQQKLKTATDALAAAQAKAAENLAAQSRRYQQEKRNAEKTTADRMAAAGAGTLRLRDPGNPALNCGTGGDRSGRTEVAAAAGGPDGPGGANLSAAAAEFLLDLTGEADDVARRLTRLQVAADELRQACTQAPP